MSRLDETIVVIYEGLYFDLAQGQMNGGTQRDSNSLV